MVAYSERVNLCSLVLQLAGVTCLRYSVLMSPNKTKQLSVHCCYPALSVLVMFGVSKRLSRCISLAVYCLHIFFVFFCLTD